MTPLYSKETVRIAISVLSSGLHSHPPKIKDEAVSLINLIENGNEVMELLMLGAGLAEDSQQGDDHCVSVERLIKKIKGGV